MQFGIPICMVLLPLCPQYALPIFIQTRTTWHYTRHCMPAMVWELTRQDMKEADLREATALGISFGGEHLFGAFEIGGLFSTGPYEQICSRMLSMAIGYRL